MALCPAPCPGLVGVCSTNQTAWPRNHVGLSGGEGGVRPPAFLRKMCNEFVIASRNAGNSASGKKDAGDNDRPGKKVGNEVEGKLFRHVPDHHHVGIGSAKHPVGQLQPFVQVFDRGGLIRSPAGPARACARAANRADRLRAARLGRRMDLRFVGRHRRARSATRSIGGLVLLGGCGSWRATGRRSLRSAGGFPSMREMTWAKVLGVKIDPGHDLLRLAERGEEVDDNLPPGSGGSSWHCRTPHGRHPRAPAPIGL